MKRNVCILLFLFFAACGLWAQQNENIEKERPSVALVLAGGGARGFSHIAIIELIEEIGIPIDMVIGTSAGALVGGLYSAGYSGQEIADAMLGLDWPAIFQDSTTRPLENALGTHSSETNIVNLQLKQDLTLDLGRGLLTGQYAYDRIKALTVKIPSYIHFDSLITPFRAAAVDLLTGELVLMDHGDIAEAMRSSMSIPAVFEPFPVDGRLYMDGFTRNNLPIQAAKDLGFDIIIAVEISAKMTTDETDFNTTPLTAINQVMALQQAVVVSKEYELADLVIYPDIYEFGQMDYALAEEIYKTGKKEAERYRDDLLAIRARIFPDFQKYSNLVAYDLPESEETSDHSFAFIVENNQIPYERQKNYSNLPNIAVDEIVINNILPSDEYLVIDEFNKIKGKGLEEKEIDAILARAYKTGNYVLVKARIDTRNSNSILELTFFPKEQKVVHIGAVGSFEGSLSKESTWAIGFSTSFQFRNLNDSGGIFSLEGSFFNNTGIEMMYFQPLGEKVFIRAITNFNSTVNVQSSGFSNAEVSGSQYRDSTASLACGLFFSPEHKLINEVGVHWIDSTQVHIDETDAVLSTDALGQAYTFDALSRYTFSTLDYMTFPSRGFYNDVTVMGVVPLSNTISPIIFDVLSTDFIIAIPFSKNVSLLVNGFVGTNISQHLNDLPELITKYGFTTYDRTFLPHVIQKYDYGIHKASLKVDFQFQPKNQLTILGGQFFAGFGLAAGDVWDNYESLLSINSVDWQASAFTGLRITNFIGLTLRAGAGSVNSDIAPYVSLDFMVKHY